MDVRAKSKVPAVKITNLDLLPALLLLEDVDLFAIHYTTVVKYWNEGIVFQNW